MKTALNDRKEFTCPTCGKRFASASSQYQHAKKLKHKRLPRPDNSEESMADIAVDAAIKRMCGEKLDILEASLLYGLEDQK